jgi:hypothetical protein
MLDSYCSSFTGRETDGLIVSPTFIIRRGSSDQLMSLGHMAMNALLVVVFRYFKIENTERGKTCVVTLMIRDLLEVLFQYQVV